MIEEPEGDAGLSKYTVCLYEIHEEQVKNIHILNEH